MILRILEQQTLRPGSGQTLRPGSGQTLRPGSGQTLRPGSGQALRDASGRTENGFAPYGSRVIWGPVLPEDRSRLTEDEARLVSAGIHSRRTAAGLLDVADPEAEFARWKEEGEAIGNEQSAIRG